MRLPCIKNVIMIIMVIVVMENMFGWGGNGGFMSRPFQKVGIDSSEFIFNWGHLVAQVVILSLAITIVGKCSKVVKIGHIFCLFAPALDRKGVKYYWRR